MRDYVVTLVNHRKYLVTLHRPWLCVVRLKKGYYRVKICITIVEKRWIWWYGRLSKAKKELLTG